MIKRGNKNSTGFMNHFMKGGLPGILVWFTGNDLPTIFPYSILLDGRSIGGHYNIGFDPGQCRSSCQSCGMVSAGMGSHSMLPFFQSKFQYCICSPSGFKCAYFLKI